MQVLGLMVVQKGECNVLDQVPIEYELLEQYGVKMFRYTLEELSVHFP